MTSARNSSLETSSNSSAMAAMTSSFAGVKLNVAAVRISKVRP